MWLKPARYSHVQDKSLYILVPNETYRNWYEQNFAELLDDAMRKLSLGVERIELICGEQTKTAPKQAKFDFDAPMAQFNPRYTFETFVVGRSNQFAHAAADAVARNPAKAYNPLFLYGGVGMGKTHLLQAIGQAILSNPEKKLRLAYVTTNQFLHEVINSLRYDRMISFHERYRNLDVLMVDDIQFVGGKERTQEELFHTFNALYEGQKQIVFTSDRPPKEIPDLEERLRSRFEWGLMADLQPPDLETKVAILMRKSELQSVRLPDEVALFMASKIHGNVRELEGSLTRLLAYCSLTATEITVGTAQQVLKSTLAAQERKITIESIQKVVADEFRLRVSDLMVKNNSKKIVYPRQIAMYLSRELAGASLPEIGRTFGGKHHTTVLHSIEKIKEGRLADKDLNKILHKLSGTLQ